MSQVIEITRRFPTRMQESVIEAGELSTEDIAAIIRAAAGDENVTRVRVLEVEAEQDRGAENVGECCTAEAGPRPEYAIELHFRIKDDFDEMAHEFRRDHAWRALRDEKFPGYGTPARFNGPGTPEALELLNAWTTLLRLRGRLIEGKP